MQRSLVNKQNINSRWLCLSLRGISPHHYDKGYGNISPNPNLQGGENRTYLSITQEPVWQAMWNRTAWEPGCIDKLIMDAVIYQANWLANTETKLLIEFIQNYITDVNKALKP